MASHPHSWSRSKPHLIWTPHAFPVLLAPGMLTFFCSFCEPNLPLPLRLGSWSSLCLEVSPPDLQKSHSSWTLQLFSNIILLKSYFLRKVFPFLLLSQSSHLCESPAIHPITLWISKGETDRAVGENHPPKPVAYHIQGWVLAHSHIAILWLIRNIRGLYICRYLFLSYICFFVHSSWLTAPPNPWDPPKCWEW